MENILFFTESFPNSKIVTLRKNYRSEEVIIRASEDLIENNEVKISTFIKDLNKSQISSAKKAGSKINVGHFSSGVTESFFISHE